MSDEKKRKPRGVEGLRARTESMAAAQRVTLRNVAIAYGATWAALRALDGKIVTTVEIDAAIADACRGAVESEDES